jgi:hypothetical protein
MTTEGGALRRALPWSGDFAVPKRKTGNRPSLRARGARPYHLIADRKLGKAARLGCVLSPCRLVDMFFKALRFDSDCPAAGRPTNLTSARRCLGRCPLGFCCRP